MLTRTKNLGRGALKKSRHFILYFLPNKNEVVIDRVFHDSRDMYVMSPKNISSDCRKEFTRN